MGLTPFSGPRLIAFLLPVGNHFGNQTDREGGASRGRSSPAARREDVAAPCLRGAGLEGPTPLREQDRARHEARRRSRTRRFVAEVERERTTTGAAERLTTSQ